MRRARDVVADHTHQIIAPGEVVQLDPAARHYPQDAQQPKPRGRDPSGHIALVWLQVLAYRVALRRGPAARKLSVVEDPGSDQLQVNSTEHSIFAAGHDLLHCGLRLCVIVLKRPRLDPRADLVVLT